MAFSLDYHLQPLEPIKFTNASEVTCWIIFHNHIIEDGFFGWCNAIVSWSEAVVPARPITTPVEPYLVSRCKTQTTCP